jgi:hypothetical protein
VGLHGLLQGQRCPFTFLIIALERLLIIKLDVFMVILILYKKKKKDLTVSAGKEKSVLALNNVLKIDIIQGVPRGKVNILGGHNIGHSKQKSVHVHVTFSEQFLRYSYFTIQCTVHCTDKQHTMSSQGCKVH